MPMLLFTTSGSQAVGAANLTSGFLVWPDPNISLAISAVRYAVPITLFFKKKAG
jgi:hypothetical protein